LAGPRLVTSNLRGVRRFACNGSSDIERYLEFGDDENLLETKTPVYSGEIQLEDGSFLTDFLRYISGRSDIFDFDLNNLTQSRPWIWINFLNPYGYIDHSILAKNCLFSGFPEEKEADDAVVLSFPFETSRCWTIRGYAVACDEFIGDGTTTSFPLSHTAVMLRDGSYAFAVAVQSDCYSEVMEEIYSGYTVSSSALTFSIPPASGKSIQVIYAYEDVCAVGEEEEEIYDPDDPPLTNPYYNTDYSDEFNDGVITNWSITTENTNFSMTNPGSTVHISESLADGFLLIQNVGVADFYRSLLDVSVSDRFTVVVKFGGSWPGPALGTESYFALRVQGQNSNTYYEVRCGWYNSRSSIRTMIANNGSPVQGKNLIVDGTEYLMIQYTGDRKMYAFASNDGIGWSQIEAEANLSNLSAFTRFGFGTYPATGTGIVAVDFIRWFDADNIYMIGES